MAAQPRAPSKAEARGASRRRSEAHPDAESDHPAGREPFGVADGVGAEHRRRAVGRIAVRSGSRSGRRTLRCRATGTKNCGWLNALSSSAVNSTVQATASGRCPCRRQGSRSTCPGPSGCLSSRCRACPGAGSAYFVTSKNCSRLPPTLGSPVTSGPPRLAELSDAVERPARVRREDRVRAVGEERREVRARARLEDRRHGPAADDGVSPHAACPRRTAARGRTGVCQVLFITTRCLTTFGSGPRSISMSYGLYCTTPIVLLPLSGALLSEPASV